MGFWEGLMAAGVGLSGGNPADVLNAIAAKNEAEAKKQREAALQQALASGGGQITPEMIQKIIQIDPMTGIKLYQQMQEAQEPKLEFNPVTGEIVDMSGGAPKVVPATPYGSIPTPVNTAATEPPVTVPNKQDVVNNQPYMTPKTRQKYDEAKAEKMAAAKVEGQSKAKAAQTFSESIKNMDALVSKLNAQGGMINTEKPLNQNLVNAAKMTDIGQMVSRASGDKNQAVVDEINNLIPVLMRDIKTATGMSAQEINSIPEMQLLKDSIGNPKASYQAVRNTLISLDNRYGTGSLAKPTRAQIEAELKRRGLK